MHYGALLPGTHDKFWQNWKCLILNLYHLFRQFISSTVLNYRAKSFRARLIRTIEKVVFSYAFLILDRKEDSHLSIIRLSPVLEPSCPPLRQIG